jgi:hypothetical protein
MMFDHGTGACRQEPFGPRSGDIARCERFLLVLRWVGWVLIAAQFAGFLLWSGYLMSHASFGHDTAIYFQSWDLIAHGHLLPRNTIQGGYYFWQNDGEFIVYLLAPLYWVFPDHLLGLLWLQDLALSGTIAVCYKFVTGRWMHPGSERDVNRKVVAAVAAWLTIVVLFVCDPWIYWVVSFDVHMEVFGVFFVACAFIAFQKHQRRGYGYTLATAMCGTASVVYVFSLGLFLSGQSVGRWYLSRGKEKTSPRSGRVHSVVASDGIPGALLMIVSILWLFSLSLLHATKGSPTGGFMYLLGPTGVSLLNVTFGSVARGLLRHPISALRTVASHSWNLWASPSAAGLFGLLTPVGFFMAVPTLLFDYLLVGQNFANPTFQQIPAFIFIALGTAGFVGYLVRHRKTFMVGLVICTLVIANEVGWFAVWFPKTRVCWVLTSTAAASVIWQAEHVIPARDEVVMTNGVAGPFGDHADLYEFDGPIPIPVRGGVVWFVMSPAQGDEVVPTAVMERALGDVMELPGASLVTASHGVYVLRWQVPPGYRSVSLGGGDKLDAWTTQGVAATSVHTGPLRAWHLASNGRRGYVLSGDYWREFSGSYLATVRISATGPVNVEVWDDTTNRLLARTTMTGPSKTSDVQLPFRIGHEKPGFVYQGAGTFRDFPIPQIPGDAIEVRVWNSGTAHVVIWSVELRRH